MHTNKKYKCKHLGHAATIGERLHLIASIKMQISRITIFFSLALAISVPESAVAAKSFIFFLFNTVREQGSFLKQAQIVSTTVVRLYWVLEHSTPFCPVPHLTYLFGNSFASPLLIVAFIKCGKCSKKDRLIHNKIVSILFVLSARINAVRRFNEPRYPISFLVSHPCYKIREK